MRDIQRISHLASRALRIALVDQPLNVVGCNSLGQAMLDQSGMHQTGYHRIATDSLLRIRDGGRSREGQNAELSGRVGYVGSTRIHAQGGDRSKIDDRALALLFHYRKNVLAA